MGQHHSLKDSLVFITGASSGIGASCARQCAELGARLLLAARRTDRMNSLADRLRKEWKVRIHTLTFDIRHQSEVDTALQSLPDDWKEIDVLVNNAGLSRGLDKLQDGKISDWEEMIDTNVKGLLYVTRAILPGMVSRSRGHIINIGSIAGHWVYPSGNVYCASKYAVKALSEGLKMDLLGTPIRVSSVDPGLVETEFSLVRFHGDRERAKKVYEGLQPLSPDDIADAVVYCATRPPHVNINEIVVMPVAQASATLVHRRI
jgi:3-hydroxy acid dehydrogenase / malonic semialdehyde reductase